MIIRGIEIDDMPVVMRMLQEFHAYAGMGALGVPFCAESIKETLAHLTLSETGVCFVADVDGRLVGCCAGIISPWFYNRTALVLTELWLWVDEIARSHGVGKVFVDELMTWGKDKGCSRVVMAGLDGKHTDGFYKKMGFDVIETHYIRGL